MPTKSADESLKSFFDEFVEGAPVLTKAPSCSLSVDRFHLSCRLQSDLYPSLSKILKAQYKAREFDGTKSGMRGLRASVYLKGGKGLWSAKPALTAPPAPHRRADQLDLQLFYGRFGKLLRIEANGSYDHVTRNMYYQHVEPFLQAAVAVKLNYIELAWDIPAHIDSVLIVPVKVSGRLCVQDDGYYFGARPSDYSAAVYDRAALTGGVSLNSLTNPLTRVETRLRPGLPICHAPKLATSLGRIAAYLLGDGGMSPMAVFEHAWKRGDTRSRKRFLERMKPFRLQVDIEDARQVLEHFSLRALPPSMYGALSTVPLHDSFLATAA
jgi:hypothetical protein